MKHEVMGLVPLEICVLAELSHPNVVQVYTCTCTMYCMYYSIQCSLFIKDTIGPTLPVLNTCIV